MSVLAPGTRWYNTVWRWHFYAGLLCIPFVLWLALTGSLYLWRPQVEAWLDQRFDHLATSAPARSPDAQVAAALRAVPGASLRSYVLPDAPGHAVRVIVTSGGVDTRVYVDPATLAVLHVAPEATRLFPLLSRLHGELLAGTIGSGIVEIAACWAVTMLLTGLYLWWPRARRGLGGVLYPRLRGGKRLFWRDLHATAGIWVSLFALGLIGTGLPWANVWGSYLVEIRALTGTSNGPVDWTIGGKPPKPDPAADLHADHAGMAGMAGMMAQRSAAAPPGGDLTRVVRAAQPLALAPPVLVAPPKTPGAPWKVSSDAADRPLRAEATFDGATGQILHRSDFTERHWIDRLIGYGIAAHEGALFGVANQIAGTLTALLLALLAGSGAVLWWHRRPVGLLGAPIPLTRPRYGPVLIGGIVALGLSMPLFGATLLLVLAVERLVLRNLRRPKRWLGLSLV
ncbi:PepSY-associated TM helix domain-containing protein [Sphingomonas sp. PAMC 26617]|uniref:PepSY-associated TM helix domain-containing protein n=1 Tax=Sphingomonas sp. PAMC 26617 TaxID=1112216 RepID=UPI0002894341|nr:PepSY domain-containing protein [Sphingomonas sp. PAMC 26617]